jgi:hypothetical protein
MSSFKTTYDEKSDSVTARGQGHTVTVYRDPEETPGGFLIFCHVEGRGAVSTVEIKAEHLPRRPSLWARLRNMTRLSSSSSGTSSPRKRA